MTPPILNEGNETINASNHAPHLSISALRVKDNGKRQQIEGQVVIRAGLSGINSVEIIAHDSTMQDILHGRLTKAGPILIVLDAAMRTIGPEVLEGRS